MERSVFNRIVGIVKEMNAQGVAESEIQNNLKQMGLNEEEIEEIITRAKPQVNVAEVHEQASKTKQMIESGEHLKPAMQKLDENSENMERVHTHLGEIHEKQQGASEDIEEIRKEIEEIKEDIAEIKPMIASIKRLNDSMIKLNKKMLTQLSAE